MAAIDVRNDSAGWLVLWLEPLGEDRWLRPGEMFRVRTECLGDDPAFSVTVWGNDDDRAAGIENVTVWVLNGDVYAEVTDAVGDVVECGHQCPADVDRKWRSLAEEAARRTASRTAPENLGAVQEP
jgi:hypothetical protein